MKTLRLAPLLVLAFAVGCRNPFDPSADIRLEQFTGNQGLFVEFTQADAAAGVVLTSLGDQVTPVVLVNYSTVAAQITSYTVVYRQLTAQPGAGLAPGSPIPSLGGAAGRRFNFIVHIAGLADDTTSAGFNSTALYPSIITAELIQYIGGPQGNSTIGGGIDCEVIFFGEDHNGHEVKVPGSIHVQVD